MAFRKGLTYQELAEANGEKEYVACFILPPGSAAVLRPLPGFEHYDESRHCVQCHIYQLYNEIHKGWG
eukprot:6474800-Pyramimonas_sp.AAC.1